MITDSLDMGCFQFPERACVPTLYMECHARGAIDIALIRGCFPVLISLHIKATTLYISANTPDQVEHTTNELVTISQSKTLSETQVLNVDGCLC